MSGTDQSKAPGWSPDGPVSILVEPQAGQNIGARGRARGNSGPAGPAGVTRMWTGRCPEAPPSPAAYGSYRELGLALYTDYVLLVEMAGLLLLAAIVGALILAKRKID